MTRYIWMMAFPALALITACPRDKQKNTTGWVVSSAVTSTSIDSANLVHHLAYLSSAQMEGRKTATPGNRLAREYIIRVFDSLKLQKLNNSYVQAFPFGSDSGYNVMGYIKGSQYTDSCIVISAHYDHLGVRNGVIYYGADDNASGTAALLAMAGYFTSHPPLHSMLFVAFDAEEQGLIGSRHFVGNSPLPLSSITFNLNMDMVSRNDNNEIYASGTFHYPFLKAYVDSIQAITPVHLAFGHDDAAQGGSQDWTSQSDHFAFHQHQIPYLYFGVEDHADYHQPGDTFDKVDKSFYYRVCRALTAVVALIDRQAVLRQ